MPFLEEVNKKDFVQFKNLIRCRSENNFVGQLK